MDPKKQKEDRIEIGRQECTIQLGIGRKNQGGIMMKTNKEQPLCNCGNHNILPDLSICEICMGTIRNDWLWAQDNRYDEKYLAELLELQTNTIDTKP